MEHRHTTAAATAVETTGSFPKTAEVGVAVPRVVCKPYGTLVVHYWNYLQRVLVWSCSSSFLSHLTSPQGALLIDGSVGKFIAGQVQILH
jgi:hypothetical protein